MHGLHADQHRPGASIYVHRHTDPSAEYAFEQDTRAYMKHERYEVSLDLWRMPSAGNQRPATGIDLWSLMTWSGLLITDLNR